MRLPSRVVDTPTYLQIYPSTLVGASRMEKIAKSLHSNLPVHTTELVGVQAKHLPSEIELVTGVKVVRISGSDRPGNLGRALRHLLWQPRVYLHYRTRSVGAVAAHNVWVLPLAYRLAKRAQAPLIYNAHELETRTASMHGLKRVLASTIEKRYIYLCAVVSVVNDHIGKWYAETYGIARPIAVSNIPEDRAVRTNLRQSLGIAQGEMLYVHTGHLSEGRNIPAILDAFRSSEHHVVFFGDGKYRNEIVSASRGHRNIHWHPPVDADIVVSHVREADAGLCLVDLGDSLNDQLATPNKLMEYLAAQRPALTTDFPEARRWMYPHQSTWVVKDVSQLADYVSRISKNDISTFQHTHRSVPTWGEQVQPLVRAYQSAISSTGHP